ncbi:MAG: NAD-dependent epimerase/dehydratase family protein [Clostridia bacterium]|nr:NAD-dependent epimerase/dehydratase family protein [Clostridia bacterium]
MDILVIGGTRFFGIPMVEELLRQEHHVTVATRGNTHGMFGDRVAYLTLQRNDPDSMRTALQGKHFDVVIDKIAYCSNDIRYALDVLDCEKYIHMSSTAVYNPKHMDTKETDYDPCAHPLLWCARDAASYAEVKRQAEHALFQAYPDQKSIAVRYPFVIGADDYTRRLHFYIEHTLRGIPMYIDNLDAQMGYIHSDEAGLFMAHLVTTDFVGAINGCSRGTISLREIIEYVEKKCKVRAVLSPDGDPAPYNGEVAYSINTNLASSLGFTFSNLHDWIYDLIDHIIKDFG